MQLKSQMGLGTQFGFELVLPVVKYEIDKTTQSKQPIIGIEGKGPKVLIVDDNWENRAVFLDLLSPLGFEMLEANNGRDGLEKARAFQPDVIITDLVMPEMDGFELIRLLRQSPVLKNKIIIATSVSVYESDHQKSLTAGGDAFLPKPVDVETLFVQLQQLLNLTWVYSDKLEETAEENRTAQPMVFPPEAEVAELYELSLMADVNELAERLTNFAQSYAQLKPFVAKMQGMLKKYQLDKISEWLEEQRGEA